MIASRDSPKSRPDGGRPISEAQAPPEEAHERRRDEYRRRETPGAAALAPRVSGRHGHGRGGSLGALPRARELGDDPARPPQLYEYFLDNFWFDAADLEHQAINAPLKGRHKADIVVLGGGFTGLSSAYHLSRAFPNKKIVLLEGACCGYGASGRNGGFCDAGFSGLLPYVHAAGPERGRQAFDASLFGIHQVKRLMAEHGVPCDFEENGMLEAAIDEEQAKRAGKAPRHLRGDGSRGGADPGCSDLRPRFARRAMSRR